MRPRRKRRQRWRKACSFERHPVVVRFVPVTELRHYAWRGK